MLYSMTGFGKYPFSIFEATYNFEIRTLNSKHFECNMRIHPSLKMFELPLRRLILTQLHRGTIDCYIHRTDAPEDLGVEVHFNKNIFESLCNQVRPTAQNYGITDAQLFEYIIRLPQVFSTQCPQNNIGEDKWQFVCQCAEMVLKEVNKFRLNEGMETEKDLRCFLKEIICAISYITERSPARIQHLRQNFQDKLEHLRSDPSRLEQELISYAERVDISEELNRLSSHINYFIDVLEDKSIMLKGKKLNFIAQEMNREINTMGAKAQDSDIQKSVIIAKENVEKIKEQTANIL